MNQLYIGAIHPHCTGEGPGLRTAVYVSGCSIRCPHCQNPHLFERSAGRAMSVSDVMALILDSHDGRVSVLGGEPLDQPDGVASLCTALRGQGIHIIIYTGYLYERLLAKSALSPALHNILNTADILVDGSYVEALKDENIQYRGSRNQRVIDLAQTRASGNLTLLDWDSRITITIRPGSISIPVCDATRSLIESLGGAVTEHVCGHLPADEIISSERVNIDIIQSSAKTTL
jgi:anaerobic ribonucleoside-triphosphate reductase activating protein